MESNIEQLVQHLKTVFKEAMNTNEFKDHAQKAGDAMRLSVIDKLRGRPVGYDFNQSGQLLRELRNNIAEVVINKTGSKAKIGYGEIDDLNQQTKRGPQVAITHNDAEVPLHAERDLPSWIIAEFGRRAGNGASPSGIPEEFIVKYGSRDQTKEFVSGPFSSLYRMRKRVFFMTSYKDHGNLSLGMGLSPRRHPGIHAGRIFRDGLENSKEEVNQHIDEGFYESIKELANRYGGTVERL